MPKVRDPEIVKFIEDCHFKKLQCQKGYEKYKKVFFNYETEIMPFVKWQALFYQIKKEHAGWWRKIRNFVIGNGTPRVK